MSTALLGRLGKVLGRPVSWFLEDGVPEAVRPARSMVRDMVARFEALELVEVPMLGRAPAGAPLTPEAQAREWIEIPKALIEGVRRPFALVASGESLADLGIEDGDNIVVDPDAQVIDGKVYVVRIGSEVTAKRLYREDGHLRLEGANGSYEIMEPHRVECLGRVVLGGRWRKY